ncbi:MAG TPA: 30S ribosomal protein S6 [Candidatus Magasanikbacteria bacterium]|nr:MAG: 30S ribosomal protein S6 [Candidatus Magasanikbacteria bacterium RIFOXYC2_FULL_39_8]HAT04008.1 30S ribosomal protein S6 [Candidatus Magasanikbacteria bacterium]
MRTFGVHLIIDEYTSLFRLNLVLVYVVDVLWGSVDIQRVLHLHEVNLVSYVMKYYELFCVLPGTLSEDEVAPVVESVVQTLKSQNAQDISVEQMGKSRLAYPIKQIRYGYFHSFRFQLESGDVAKLERSVRLLENILRVVMRVYDPRTKATSYKLAQDPTALSAPRYDQMEEKRSFVKEEPKREAAKITEEHKPSESQPAIAESEHNDVVASVETKEEKTEDAVEEKVVRKPRAKAKEKISIDDIDKKLDEILQQDIDKV